MPGTVGTGGFFLKGLAGSLQGLPQQIYEVRWRAKEEKKLQAKQNELRERLSLYTNTVTELSKDGWYSQDDMSKLNTILIAGGAEFQEIVKETHSHIKSMNQTQVKQDFELVDSFIEMMGEIDLKDMPGAFETMRGFIKSKGALTKLAAYDGLKEGRYKAAQEKKDLEIVGKLPSEYKYPYMKEKGIVGEITPTAKAPEDKMAKAEKELDFWHKIGDPVAFNNRAKALGYPATFETYKKGFEAPEIPKEGEPVKRTDIEYWRKREDTVKSEEDWDRYLLDLEQSESNYKTEDATWKDRLLRDIKDLESGIKNQLLDKDGKIRLLNKDGTPKEMSLGGKKMTIEEAYITLQKLHEEKVRELMEKYSGTLDISTLIKFLSLEEIGKVTGWDWISRAKGYLSGEAKDISLISTY